MSPRAPSSIPPHKRLLLERLPLAAGRPIFGYVAAVALAGLALAARMAVADWLPPGFPFVTFFPAVILSAFLFGLKPGILTAILCGIASIPFFPTPPDGQLFGIGGIVALGFYTFVVVTDIALVHWMQRANARLAAERERTATLAERSDLLFSELQHRVSNNLQVVASLLHLQRRNISDETARTALAESARRLELIGRIHRQLHDPNGVQVGNTLFFQQLGDGLVEAEGRPEVRCQVMADDAIILKPEQVVPVALIVAEAIANSLEHGLKPGHGGTIVIRFFRNDGMVTVEVDDNGYGLPKGFDLDASESLGLHIARTLARQLGGTFVLEDTGQGACASVAFPG